VPFTAVDAPVVASGRPRTVLDPGTVALSIQETADVLGVSKGTVNNLINQGKLAVKKVGRRTLVQADSVRAFLA
jgi:excisionase family DNA binding protein